MGCSLLPFEEKAMRWRINLNFRLLYESVTLTLFVVGGASALLYLTHLLLSMLFYSPAVFASLFGLAIVVGVLLHCDVELFQWDNNPRIAIKRFRDEEDEDDEE